MASEAFDFSVKNDPIQAHSRRFVSLDGRAVPEALNVSAAHADPVHLFEVGDAL
jgi:hypothetical protein